MLLMLLLLLKILLLLLVLLLRVVVVLLLLLVVLLLGKSLIELPALTTPGLHTATSLQHYNTQPSTANTNHGAMLLMSKP